MDLSTFIAEARAWLDDHAERLTASAHAAEWGAGSDDVQVFHDLTDDQERQLLCRAMAWQREKFDAGYGALTWPVELGGAGLPQEFATAFEELEAGYVHPPHHETFSVTLDLVAPTIAQFGQAELRDQLLPHLVTNRRAELSAVLRAGGGVRPRRARRLAPSATATPGSSTARRRGAPAPGSPSGASSSPAAISTCRSIRA